MSLRDVPLDQIIEAALLAAGEPLTLERLAGLFDEYSSPTRPALREALSKLEARHPADKSALELIETASGWRLRVRQQYSPWVSRLWEERPQRYSRALLETLALVAYRQPVTRGDIEQVRGVTVSSSIMRTLVERGWVRVVGHRDVPGRPAVFATTRQFLDDFGLKTLEELPPVHELKGFEGLEQLEADLYDVPPSQTLPLPDDPDGETEEAPADGADPEHETAAESAPDAEAGEKTESGAETGLESGLESEGETDTGTPVPDDWQPPDVTAEQLEEALKTRALDTAGASADTPNTAAPSASQAEDNHAGMASTGSGFDFATLEARLSQRLRGADEDDDAADAQPHDSSAAGTVDDDDPA
ncbi:MULTISPECIES: SMC-Scp complex subunit ScpB [unclassified Cobetia]|uniref:SMC-Scp complex subunit ScpB n=1 Tax=unclassified Cobetia TaxID=2609414 RepID=UPI0020976C9A|nr:MULTISPECIES: SMC-Scp complex subunit ScpB [unclassified Cobetia]MCO7233666.1 SMC-Scp complex subunit ScpB [Cobetia sp. Dlab-2-AX]MCO7236862.1 SMC-Scp complex subunit ScpB [Cobetia sp. Dlab-2-U]